MADPSNPRQIFPSTVSSASAAGPAAPSKARVSIACESCKRRKCKCTGGPPCESCFHANIQCVFDETQDKRRKVHVKRTIEDLTSVNDDLTLHVKIFRRLQKAIQNDTHHGAFEQIRQHATLRDIALALPDSIPETEDGEGDAADAAQSLHGWELADGLPAQALHRSRVSLSADEAMDVQQQTESSSSDVMELDPPATDALVGSDMRRMKHERNHYRGIVAQLQNGTRAEAEESFRRLRASSQRHTFVDSQLSLWGGDLTTLGTSRTLPEMSGSICTPRASWFEREGLGNGPLSATPPQAAPQSATNASTSGPQARVSSPYRSGFATATGLSQYITSAKRLRRESGTFADKEFIRSK